MFIKKQVDKAKLFSANQRIQAQIECSIHAQMKHSNIIKAYNYVEDEKCFTQILEYCNDASYFEEKIINVSKSLKSLTKAVLSETHGN